MSELRAYWGERAKTYLIKDLFGRRILENYLHRLDIVNLVEVGCGPGTLFYIYHRIPRVMGIDWSPLMLMKARNRIKRHDYDHITLKKMDLSIEQDFDERFDVLVSRTFLMHIPPERFEVACRNCAKLSDRLLIFEYWEPIQTIHNLSGHNWLHDYSIFQRLGYEVVEAYHRPDLPQVLYDFKRVKDPQPYKPVHHSTSLI